MDENGKDSDAERQNRPKLDAGEGVADGFGHAAGGQAITSSSADTAQAEPGEAAPVRARDTILPRSLRLAMMAIPLAAAAAFGSFVGSLSAGGITQFWPRAPSSSSVAASDAQAPNAELAALSALKTYVEGAARNANNQFAKLADRLDRIERAQAEPNARLARVAEAVDRLDKERKSVLAAAAAAGPETTGTVPNSPSAPAEAKILPNWILHGVRGNRALVENRHGDIFEITGDSTLPGLGRVEGIKRQDGQWVVVTARGLITSAP
jgi:hypothetical protein